jgi:hypothetical protein
VLAYVFWHRPREDVEQAAYEAGGVAFHRSLARTRPAGLRASASFRVAELPWLEGGYEDWYLVDDFAALGVLNEAAVGRGHRSAHDHAAHLTGAGSAGLYGFVEGGASLGLPLATWVTKPSGSSSAALGELLGDGMDPMNASLWRRQLVLGPAPEFCLLAEEPSPGVSLTRLPQGWSARSLAREVLYDG